MHLLAIAYPDEFTGPLAMDELERLGGDFLIRRDQIAAIVRSDETFTTFTNAVITRGQPAWAMFWTHLFAVLFFVPMLRMGVGSDLAPIIDRVRRAGLQPLFEERIRDQLSAGTSALFVLIEKTSPDAVVSALDVLGGSVLQVELANGALELLQDALPDDAGVA
jgi:uncharacterized membrane protein